MSSVAASHRLYIPESALVARTMLGELRSAHRNLIAQLAAMEALTAGALADPVLCANGRWRLSQASLGRRLLATRVCDYFLQRLVADKRTALLQLIAADQALLKDSSAHLGRWTAEHVRDDWTGFRAASREMWRKTFEHIASEQRVLYPMLEQAAARL